MRRLIAAFLACLVLGTTITYGEDSVYTRRKNEDDEAWLWTELSEHSPSDYITAAVLSYFYRESQYRSDAISGWGYFLAVKGYDICDVVLEETDGGLHDGSSHDYFVEIARARGGYGLGQWYASGYVEHLYSFAVEYGSSIGDAHMQCAFVFESLKANEELWEKLLLCTNADRAGMLIAIYYDGTKTGVDGIRIMAKDLYDKYHVDLVEIVKGDIYERNYFRNRICPA